MKLTPKMRAVRRTLARKFHAGFSQGQDCIAILDRLRFLCGENPVQALMALPRFRSTQSRRVKLPAKGKSKGYGRAHWFKRESSGMTFAVESERREGWLAPCAVTLIADDRTGLLPEEVFSILEVLQDARLTMVELAFDFSALTKVTRSFVLRHGVFGKSWRDLSGENPAVDWWGPKNGSKRVKSYWKDAICGQRVELMMRSRFLRHYGIRDIFDFQGFVDLLPGRHFLFAQLDEQKLIHRLRGSGFSAERTLRILRAVHGKERDIWELLSYLRREVGLTNVQRLLLPLRENRLIQQSLREWAAKWPKKPPRLQTKSIGSAGRIPEDL